MRALVTLLVLLGAAPAFARVCGDSCLEAARGDYVTCRQDAGATFALAKQLCRDRDPACVQACAERQQDCNTATGSGAALEACLAQQQAALASCVDRFAAGTKKRDQCLENARIDGFQCRNRARTGTAPELRHCRAEFDACADGCGPGEPPRGARLCELEARRARSTARTQCNQTANADKSACLKKNAACSEACRDARTACDAPALSAVGSGIAACEADRRAAAASCRAANPVGTPLLDQCLEDADTDAFVCRNAAKQAQAPALAACVQEYVGCVRACPPG
jgi:hypothetical protein